MQRPKQRGAEVAPIKFDVKQDKQETEEEEEPEYAPPPVEPRAYESDVLPLGLTMEGLKDENLLRGYYDYYHNPIDANGVSRKDKQLEDEMERMVERAAERNERDLRDLDWTVRRDDSGPATSNTIKTLAPKSTNMPKTIRRDPGTLSSRRAAAALSQPSEGRSRAMLKPQTPAAPTRRPLSSLLQGNKTTKRNIPVAKDPSSGPTGAIASRTTLGYNKGRSASSVVHPRRNVSAPANKTPRAPKDGGATDGLSEETITPARARQAMRQAVAPASPSRPQFLSIFDDLDDDEDLPTQNIPQSLLEDDEEEFELRLDI